MASRIRRAIERPQCRSRLQEADALGAEAKDLGAEDRDDHGIHLQHAEHEFELQQPAQDRSRPDVVEALEQVELERQLGRPADRRTGVIARSATMSPRKVAALMRNGDATPSVAIAMPPTTGPTSVEIRPAAALSVTASDRWTRWTSRGNKGLAGRAIKKSIVDWAATWT